MVSNRITEGVGKKIVEALKQQSDIEIQNVVENPVPVAEEHPAPAENEIIIMKKNQYMKQQMKKLLLIRKIQKKNL